jgi:hypothetical protein
VQPANVEPVFNDSLIHQLNGFEGLPKPSLNGVNLTGLR